MQRLSVNLFFFFFNSLLFAYPEMIRHGYVSCTSCHVSPQGAGLLTAYGRTLSAEVLSTWSRENETSFAYGLVPALSGVQLGGDVRLFQYHLATKSFNEGRFIGMQADLEAAVNLGKWSMAATGGWSEASSGKFSDGLVSRRHWVGYQVQEGFLVRLGRFDKAYGLNIPDHMALIRAPMGRDQGTETYNLEGSYFWEGGEAFLTGVFGRIDKPSLVSERGVAVRSAWNFQNRYKVGFGYFYGESSRTSRHLVGPYAELGFTEKLFLLAELDYQNLKTPSTNAVSEIVNYLKLGYEIHKGVILYGTQEWLKPNLDATASTQVYGLGVQFFPRPHFELNVYVQKQLGGALDIDFLGILGHFYL